MGLLSTYYAIAAEEPTGLAVEQLLRFRGFHEIGRRRDAVALGTNEENSVIRLSRDAEGSEAYFTLAQKMAGNPYMPVVLGQKTLPSGDHIAWVERLENPGQNHIRPRVLELRDRINNNEHVSVDERGWFEEMKHAALMSSSLRHFFTTANFHMDIDSLPEPAAFREAATAIMDLSAELNLKNSKWVPAADINETNVMWRRTEAGLFPVLYDSVSGLRQDRAKEVAVTAIVRQRLDMPQLASLS